MRTALTGRKRFRAREDPALRPGFPVERFVSAEGTVQHEHDQMR
jgi:hypothetical protein